jgi:hypothetical protein
MYDIIWFLFIFSQSDRSEVYTEEVVSLLNEDCKACISHSTSLCSFDVLNISPLPDGEHQDEAYRGTASTEKNCAHSWQRRAIHRVPSRLVLLLEYISLIMSIESVILRYLQSPHITLQMTTV